MRLTASLLPAKRSYSELAHTFHPPSKRRALLSSGQIFNQFHLYCSKHFPLFQRLLTQQHGRTNLTLESVEPRDPFQEDTIYVQRASLARRTVIRFRFERTLRAYRLTDDASPLQYLFNEYRHLIQRMVASNDMRTLQGVHVSRLSDSELKEHAALRILGHFHQLVAYFGSNYHMVCTGARFQIYRGMKPSGTAEVFQGIHHPYWSHVEDNSLIHMKHKLKRIAERLTRNDYPAGWEDFFAELISMGVPTKALQQLIEEGRSEQKITAVKVDRLFQQTLLKHCQDCGEFKEGRLQGCHSVNLLNHCSPFYWMLNATRFADEPVNRIDDLIEQKVRSLAMDTLSSCARSLASPFDLAEQMAQAHVCAANEIQRTLNQIVKVSENWPLDIKTVLSPIGVTFDECREVFSKPYRRVFRLVREGPTDEKVMDQLSKKLEKISDLFQKCVPSDSFAQNQLKQAIEALPKFSMSLSRDRVKRISTILEQHVVGIEEFLKCFRAHRCQFEQLSKETQLRAYADMRLILIHRPWIDFTKLHKSTWQ